MSNKPKRGQRKVDTAMHPTKSNFDCILDEDAVTVENNGKIWELSMEASVFKPEDIKIQITPTHVIIDGYFETEDEITECHEDIVIPPNILHTTIQCLMNENGVLRIRAPIQFQEIKMEARVVKTTKTKEMKEKHFTKTRETVDEEFEEEKTIEMMDDNTERRILQNRKYIDSTREIQSRNGKLEINIDVTGHKPEDIKINISKRVIAIQSVSKDEMDRVKEIHKKYLIPDGVDPNSFRAYLKKGVLTVSMDDPKSKKPTSTPPEPAEPVHIQSQIVEPKDIQSLERRCEDISKQVTKIDKKKFEAKVNMSGYKTEELRMKITKKVLIVHTETRLTTRQFYKKITLPIGVQPENITNSVSPDTGILTISAPIVEEPPTPTENIEVAPKLDLSNTSTVTEPYFEDITKHISPGIFEVEFDVSGYTPEEVEIRILKSIVTIHGSQSVGFTKRQFFKKFNIPQWIIPESIKCQFTTEGKLRIYTTQTTTKTVSETGVIQKVYTGSLIKTKITGSGLSSTSGMTVAGPDIGKFERKVDAAGYKEDEIEITIANGWITVTGKQQLGVELNFQTRQFTKKFSIPYGIKPESIKCILQTNGTLVIFADK